MIAFLRRTHPKLLLCLLLISGSFSPGCAHNLRDETLPAATTIWKIKFDGSDSSPVIADGVLYVGSADGAVYALDPKTGETKWRFQTGEGLSSGPEVITMPKKGAGLDEMIAKTINAPRKGTRSVDLTPVVRDGTVFIGSGDFSFYALDAVTGNKKWSYEAVSKILRTAVFEGSTAYIITEEGLHVLDVATGKRKWLFETLQEVPVHPLNPHRGAALGPVQGESTIFVAGSGWSTLREDAALKSFLYAVAPESGRTRWVTTLAGGVSAAPVAARGLVFIGVGDPYARLSTNFPDHKTLYAINEVDGQVRWKIGADIGWTSSQLLIVGNTIYFYTDRSLLAAELETGRRLWGFSADEFYSKLRADDDHLYLTTHKGSMDRPKDTLHALTLTTGQEKWSIELSGGLQMVHEGVVYAGWKDLYAIDAATGKKLWLWSSFKGPGRHSEPVISEGRIFLTSPTVDYFGTSRVEQGYLYAIDATTGKP